MDDHKRYAYALLGVVIFRIYWGVFGSSTARFTQFVVGPKKVFTYACTLHKPSPTPHAGHNPVGALSVLSLLLLMLVQITLGLFAIDVDGFEGGPIADYIDFDLARRFAGWHALTFNALLAVIALHIIAIVYYRVWKKQPLLSAMIHGKYSGKLAMQRPSVCWLRVAIGGGLSAAIVWYLNSLWY